MGVLDGAISYMAGPIDRADDHGIGWRRQFKKCLFDRHINIVFLDPTDKFEGLMEEVKDEKIYSDILRAKSDWEGLRNMFKKVQRVDLRMVDICDFLVAKIDTSIHMCGTYSEIDLCITEKKPILLIIEGGKKKCPSWLFGSVHYDFMFDSEDECADYLARVDCGDVKIDDRWVLMRKGIKFLENSFSNKEMIKYGTVETRV